MADVTGWGIIIGAGIAVATSTVGAVVKAVLDERAARSAHERGLERDRGANEFQLARERLGIRQRHLDERRDRVRASVESIIAAAREVAEAALDVELGDGALDERERAQHRYESARSQVVEASTRLAIEPEFDSLRVDFFQVVAGPFALFMRAYSADDRGKVSGAPESNSQSPRMLRDNIRLGYEALATHARELLLAAGERHPLSMEASERGTPGKQYES